MKIKPIGKNVIFFYDDDNLDHLRVDEQMKTLDLLISTYTDDDEPILYPETSKETNLFVLFL